MDERYTIAEASKLTGLSKRALARRIERGQLAATKVGRLRYVARRDLVTSGLLDAATGEPPPWAGRRVEPSVVAQEIVQRLVQQSVELHELRLQLEALSDESRHDDDALRTEIARARAERRELRRALEDAKAEIASLRGDA